MNPFDITGPDQVTDVAGSATVFASMRYLGLGTLVGLNYDGASNLNLTYQNGGTGTAGDKYTGLDRFGRIVETIWIKGTGDVVQGVYGRNRSSGIDWRRDDAASSTVGMDAYYEYDGLQQVTVWKRGNLSPSGGPPFTGVSSQKQGEDFTYDQTGNWLGDVSDNPNFTQSRTHNVNNQITSITGPTGVIQAAYDNAGNMTLAPSPGSWTAGYTYKWDAWNRLVEIKQGGTVIGSYAYDALMRRTSKTVGGVTRDIYYDRQWRSVEEREGSNVKVQHTWSPLDRWTLIRRKRSVSGTLDESLFCLRDYLDPVALANTSGAVVERYSYDAFGTVQIMDATFAVIGSSAYDWEFLYHGEFRDKESQLYNYGYRYLDTQLGRWLSRDPIGEEGGLNLYAMCGNNCVTTQDAFGLAIVITKDGIWTTGDGVIIDGGVSVIDGRLVIRGGITIVPGPSGPLRRIVTPIAPQRMPAPLVTPGQTRPVRGNNPSSPSSSVPSGAGDAITGAVVSIVGRIRDFVDDKAEAEALAACDVAAATNRAECIGCSSCDVRYTRGVYPHGQRLNRVFRSAFFRRCKTCSEPRDPGFAAELGPGMPIPYRQTAEKTPISPPLYEDSNGAVFEIEEECYPY